MVYGICPKKIGVDPEDFLDDLFDSWWSLIERICVYVDSDAFLRVLDEVLFIFEVAELEILSNISHPIDQNVPSCNTKIKKKSCV